MHKPECWTKNEIRLVLRHPNKNWARAFRKDLAVSFATEDIVHGIQLSFMNNDIHGIDFVVSLVLIFYTLRDEVMAAWVPNIERRPGLSNKDYARIQLREFAEGLANIDVASGYVNYIQGGVEEGSIDHICMTIDAIHDLRDEITAWY